MIRADVSSSATPNITGKTRSDVMSLRGKPSTSMFR